MKDFLSIADLTGESLRSLINEAIEMKNNGWSSVLEHKVLALTFEKPSLRTRTSFEVGMRQLGGFAIYLSPQEIGLGKREPIPDVARVLSRYADAIAVRTFAQVNLEIMAEYANVPVINALSDAEHPCQALADLMTIYEKKGDLKKLTLAYVGDGNNVANSLLLASALAGMNFNIAAPSGYAIDEKYWNKAQAFADSSGSALFRTTDPQEAVKNADVLYTDVWTSMGQEAEAEKRRQIFADYQINDKLISAGRNNIIIMHPLPAHAGEEVAAGVLDRDQSVVFDQAENRLHAQKALLARLLGATDFPLARSSGPRYR